MRNSRLLIACMIIMTLMFTVLAGCAQTAPTPQEPSPTIAQTPSETATPAPEKISAEIVIFHTNDTHGRVAGDDEAVIGVERIAAIHKSVPDSILLDAGDVLHGLPIATLNRGADMVALMNEVGYDAMVLGNHDFNYGWERLLELSEMADFPMLSTNVIYGDGPLLQSDTIIERNGVKVGVFGVTTEETATSAMPKYTNGLVFEDAAATAREKVDALRAQSADIVVALCHLGDVPCRGTLSTELAQQVPEIDVIIDGHSHSTLPQGHMENGVLIAQAGYHSNHVGRIDIALEDGEITAKSATLIAFDEALNTSPDSAAAAKLSDITAALSAVLQEPVGESQDEMSSERAPGVRTQETPLGNLVADAYRAAAGAEIAVVNGGDIREDIPAGALTKGDVVSVLPFGNTLMVKYVTPAILRQALENGVSGIIVDEDGNIMHEESAQGRFLQVSGFSFAYDPTAPAGERVVSITLDSGVELALDDDQTQISLSASNYVMTGGNEYFMLADLEVERELGAADEALAEYIMEQSPITAPDVGRIIYQQKMAAAA